jgi:ribosomal protein L37E
MTEPECPRCGSDQFHEVTTLDQVLRSLMCAECGTPWVIFRRANPIHDLEGPSVPTPDEIRIEAWRMACYPLVTVPPCG